MENLFAWILLLGVGFALGALVTRVMLSTNLYGYETLCRAYPNSRKTLKRIYTAQGFAGGFLLASICLCVMLSNGGGVRLPLPAILIPGAAFLVLLISLIIHIPFYLGQNYRDEMNRMIEEAQAKKRQQKDL